ncbi:MAG: LysM peptidoglycan-binding domain-containing protein [bacterium]|nr:LysM peptidoglycan-binding domain-containing protein [bacterium]
MGLDKTSIFLIQPECPKNLLPNGASLEELRNRIQTTKLNPSTVSLGLGVIVVFIVGLLVYTYFSRVNREGSQPIDLEKVRQEFEAAKPKGVEYVVGEGDSLSLLAEKYYGDMMAWEKIYNANKDSVGDDPNLLYVGVKLLIPDAKPEQATGGPSILKLEGQPAIPEKYTVQQDDDLCRLGVQFYSACERGWDIYAWNKDQIADPNLIYPGQIFTLQSK